MLTKEATEAPPLVQIKKLKPDQNSQRQQYIYLLSFLLSNSLSQISAIK